MPTSAGYLEEQRENEVVPIGTGWEESGPWLTKYDWGLGEILGKQEYGPEQGHLVELQDVKWYTP